MWVLLLLGAAVAALASKKPTTPVVVELKKGRTYRLKFKVWQSTPPATRGFIDGIKQGLELAGMKDVRVTYGATPTFEYTQLTAVDTTIEVGKRQSVQLGEASAVIEFLWARPVGPDVPNS